MTNKYLLPLLSAPLMLAACGSGGDGSPTEGEYKQTVKITELDFPGISADVKERTIAQMEQAAGGGTGGLFCMKGGDNGQQWKEAAKQMSGALGGQCETIKDEGSATSLDLEMTCKGTAKGDINIVMTGQANPDGYDSTMSFDIKDPDSGETAKLAMNIGAERQGDCPS
ncbi:DUF3617 family protein [Sphingorhabdus sp. EL138]|jgi:hypothetical protein|uniref:DUF3617 domain-containing protein n=1 Tax=Sphingorhabdus sp. EL138 TaxID=2073156 RepID=UPI000D694F88|nr:DUF3617 family protein [Sphingorhabdus sp. EL138]